MALLFQPEYGILENAGHRPANLCYWMSVFKGLLTLLCWLDVFGIIYSVEDQQLMRIHCTALLLVLKAFLVSSLFCSVWSGTTLRKIWLDLREDKDFTDVTLAWDDQQVKAHKVVLSSSSPFFLNTFKKNKNSHPYMRELKAKELVSIVDFIYIGEVNIWKDFLNLQYNWN